MTSESGTIVRASGRGTRRSTPPPTRAVVAAKDTGGHARVGGAAERRVKPTLSFPVLSRGVRSVMSFKRGDKAPGPPRGGLDAPMTPWRSSSTGE